MASTGQGRPDIRAISRRDFLVLTATAAGTAVLTIAPAGETGQEPPPAAEARRLRLPDAPSHNPAYMARTASDGGLLLWARKGDGAFLGYRINANGRSVWRLCNGKREVAEIAAEYGGQTGRSASEATTFLDRLLSLTVVASAAFVVPGPGFPKPSVGGCYRLRVTSEDPLTE